MKNLALFALIITSLNAQAFFRCETKTKTAAGNPSYTVTVYEATRTRPYILTLLTVGDNVNVPTSFSCEKGTLTENGAKLTELACETTGSHLSVYASEKGSKFTANLYSDELSIDVENLVCDRE